MLIHKFVNVKDIFNITQVIHKKICLIGEIERIYIELWKTGFFLSKIYPPK